MVETFLHTKEEILQMLSSICDPEIPVVTIQEMGMLRDVILKEDECEVIITPTYTGCPAMGIIEHDIIELLLQSGIEKPKVTLVYSPAWTTDWMTDSTKEKLRVYGIAAPLHSNCTNWLKLSANAIQCPKCGSTHTQVI